MEQAWFDELAELLRIPSVSADPAHAADVRAAGEWVRDFVRAAGGTAEVRETDAQPLVLGELPASSGEASAPTVLVYGHFDVQPPAPLDEWESPPFEPEIRGEWLYGRGVADDKGQLYLLLKAAELLAAEGALPVNIRVACDGEEEIGGHSIVDFLADDERGADACVIFDSGMTRPGQPEFALGVRGLLYFHLRIATGERDLHSGIYGGAALNAMHALVETLAPLMPRAGRLPEPLRAGILAASPEETAGWSELPQGAELLGDAGARPVDTRAAEEYWLRTTAEPALDVNGLAGGSPTLQKTVLPVVGEANFSVRLAPGQDVEEIAQAVEAELRKAAPAGAELELTRLSSSPAGLIPPDSPAVQLALGAFERVCGVRPLLVRSGGTLPIIPALADKGIPTIMTGFALSESNIHSPNERLRVDYVPLGVRAAQELYRSFAGLR